MLKLLEAVLLALSLSADCFAVSACSSLGIRSSGWRKIAFTALLFALVQSSFFVTGCAFGSAVAGLVERLAHVIGFLLLLYVGGSMILDALRKEEGERSLDGFGAVMLGAVATSIDAIAVGISLSISGESFWVMALDAASILLFTFISVLLGISLGHAVGKRFGRAAGFAGGAVLLGIGLAVLFG